MRTMHFHMPHLQMPPFLLRRRRAPNPHPPGSEHHHAHMEDRMQRIEGTVDLLIIAGIVLLGAAMVYGLFTASGEAPWW